MDRCHLHQLFGIVMPDYGIGGTMAPDADMHQGRRSFTARAPDLSLPASWLQDRFNYGQCFMAVSYRICGRKTEAEKWIS